MAIMEINSYRALYAPEIFCSPGARPTAQAVSDVLAPVLQPVLRVSGDGSVTSLCCQQHQPGMGRACVQVWSNPRLSTQLADILKPKS